MLLTLYCGSDPLCKRWCSFDAILLIRILNRPMWVFIQHTTVLSSCLNTWRPPNIFFGRKNTGFHNCYKKSPLQRTLEKSNIRLKKNYFLSVTGVRWRLRFVFFKILWLGQRVKGFLCPRAPLYVFGGAHCTVWVIAAHKNGVRRKERREVKQECNSNKRNLEGDAPRNLHEKNIN